MVLRFQLKSSPDDFEKALLPTIVFANANHPGLRDLEMRGFILTFGWWHYYLRIVFINANHPD